MSSYVRCQCGVIYDLGRVHVTARYTDCSMWRAPCCNAPIDSRDEGRRYVNVKVGEAGDVSDRLIIESGMLMPRVFAPGHAPWEKTPPAVTH